MQLQIVTSLLALATNSVAQHVLVASDFPSACSGQCENAISLSTKCADSTDNNADYRQCVCGAGARNELMYCAACSISNGKNEPDGDLAEMLTNCGWNYADAAGTSATGAASTATSAGDSTITSDSSSILSTITGGAGGVLTTLTSDGSQIVSTITVGAGSAASSLTSGAGGVLTTLTSDGSAVVSTITSGASGATSSLSSAVSSATDSAGSAAGSAASSGTKQAAAPVQTPFVGGLVAAAGLIGVAMW